MLNPKAHQKLSTLKFVTIDAVKSISKAFITNVNKPRVKILIGRVRSIKTGFSVALIIPSTNAIRNAVTKFFTWTPGNKYELTTTAKALIIQFLRISIPQYNIILKPG